MKKLEDFEEQVYKCSKCGLCQAGCPLYAITGNDCTVSRGQFVMLKGILKGKLRMSKTVFKYLDMCLKCGACSKFCPSGINVVDVIIAAKAEYFKTHFLEKLISFVQRKFIFGLFMDLVCLFKRKTKSLKFDRRVLYFGGCQSKWKGDKSVVRLLNSIGVEVINPSFSCCGIPVFTRGDLEGFKAYIKEYAEILKKYEINEVVTTCASCEKTLKDYVRWVDDSELKDFLSNINVRNVYEYLYKTKPKLKLKKKYRVTFHKPCNIENFSDIEWVLNNIENLEYVEMPDYDKCCGLNGLFKIKEYKIMCKIFKNKHKKILQAGVKDVLTSCFGCEMALKAYSFGKYKVYDLMDYIADRI